MAAPGLSCSMWDLVPWPGIELRPLALGAQSLPLDHQGSPWLCLCSSCCFHLHTLPLLLFCEPLCIPQIKTQNPPVEPFVTALGYLLHLLCSVHLHTSIYPIEPWAHLLSTSSTRLSCIYPSQCPQGWLVEWMNNISETVIVDFFLVSSLRINTQDHMIKSNLISVSTIFLQVVKTH